MTLDTGCTPVYPAVFMQPKVWEGWLQNLLRNTGDMTFYPRKSCWASELNANLEGEKLAGHEQFHQYQAPLTQQAMSRQAGGDWGVCGRIPRILRIQRVTMQFQWQQLGLHQGISVLEMPLLCNTTRLP